MSLAVGKQVNLGSRKTGLSTVGATVYNKAGVVNQARTTDGVSEVIAGIYRKEFVLDDSFEGFILWDTGEATPLYAVETFDYRLLLEPAVALGPFQPTRGQEVWTETEKKKILNDTKTIKKAVKKIEVSPAITESTSGQIRAIKESIEMIREQIDKIEPANVVQEGVNQLSKGLETLGKGLSVLIEGQKAKSLIEEVENYVEAKIT